MSYPPTNFYNLIVGYTSSVTGDYHASSTSSSDALEINSNNGVLLISRLTQSKINAITPSNGMIVFNTTSGHFQVYSNGWGDIDTAGGNVISDSVDSSTPGNIVTFVDTGGTHVQDSGVNITQVPPLFASSSSIANVGQIDNLGSINFNALQGLTNRGDLYVDSLSGIQMISNTFGESEEQVCTVITGGTPSSSTTPSALLELQSTTGALLVSSMKTTDRDALTSPAPGMILYNQDALGEGGAFQMYQNGQWASIGNISAATSPPVTPSGIVLWNDESGTSIKDSVIPVTTALPGMDGMSIQMGYNTGDTPTVFTGPFSTAFGTNSLVNNTSGAEEAGHYNTAFGFECLTNNTVGSRNVAIGYQALFTNATGSDSIAIGAYALTGNTTGVNIAIGSSALMTNSTGTNNIAIGYKALMDNADPGGGYSPGNDNIALGYLALMANQYGQDNIAIGSNALSNNRAYSSNNIAIGTSALEHGANISNNVAIGVQAFSTIGVEGVGSGTNNVGIGVNVGNASNTYNYCTLLGAYADVSPANAALTNATAIGANSVVGASNSIVLGRIENVESAIPPTNVGIGTITPQAALHVLGGQMVNVTSVAANYTVLNTDYIIGCDTSESEGEVTITIPIANTVPGQVFYVKDQGGDSDEHAIAVVAADVGPIDGIDGAKRIQDAYGCEGFYSNGSAWFTLSINV